jgi:hypothetical protein
LTVTPGAAGGDDGSTQAPHMEVEQLVQLVVVEEADDRGELALELLPNARLC